MVRRTADFLPCGRDRGLASIGFAGDRGRSCTPIFLAQTLAAGIALSVATKAVPAVAGEAAVLGESAITCINPASGATWQIVIDYERGAVDSNPARISAATISWHDAKDGGNYTLDRKSGALTVIVASSTGGYFLYDRCRLDNSG